jgi:hypothetical protein
MVFKGSNWCSTKAVVEQPRAALIRPKTCRSLAAKPQAQGNAPALPYAIGQQAPGLRIQLVHPTFLRPRGASALPEPGSAWAP